MTRKMHPEALAVAGNFQRAAMARDASVWIAANAGTGKTEVLTYRILALLLADPGLSPGSILAVTFTNAAAAEMAHRLSDVLHEWNALDDEKLRRKLHEVTGFDIGEERLKRFRQLPALVTDAPPLMTTLHGLAHQVVGRLPEGGGLPQNFELIEDVTQGGLLAEALARAVRDANDAESDALDLLLEEKGDSGWREISKLMEDQWQPMADLMTQSGSVQAFLLRLRRELGLGDGDTADALQAAMRPTDEEQAALEQVKHVLGGKEWMDILFKKESNIEGEGPARVDVLTKTVARKFPEADRVLQQAQVRVAALRDRWRGLRTFELTRALLVWWGAVRVALERLKQQRGVRTFADVMDSLEKKLEQAGSEDIWQRLERRFVHLLVDEAQDNNPQQARVVAMLAQAFLSGDVGTGTRTVLAVGDLKQSIYRFQGAEPRLFVQLRDFLRQWGRLVTVNSCHSFRSPAVLMQVVEEIFGAGEARAALLEGEAWAHHDTVYPHAAGRAEVWPLLKLQKEGRDEGFHIEAQPRWQREGGTAFGAQLAAWLKARRDAGVIMPSTGEPLQWKDVLVIMQRNADAAALAGALNAAGVPAVLQPGRRNGLPAPMVADIIALMQVVGGHHPLALAQVLKSPLVGWGDDRVVRLAGEPLGDIDAEAAAWLAHWNQRSLSVPPGVWLAELCAQPGLVEGYVRRGPLPAPAVRAAVAGLVLAARKFETSQAALAVWEDNPPAALAGSGDSVTVTTLHKAKGLGYPLVVLGQTTYKPNLNEEKLAWRRDEKGEPDLVVLRRTMAGRTQLQEALDDAELARKVQDQWRGLYVALTRAKDWLVVGGWGDEPDGDHWYGWVSRVARHWPQEGGLRVRAEGEFMTQPVAGD